MNNKITALENILEDISTTELLRLETLIELASTLLAIDEEKALYYNKCADDLAKSLRETSIQQALIDNNFGIYCYKKNLNTEALLKFIAADKILSKSELLEHRILSKSDIALIYARTHQYEEALKVHLQIEKELKQIPLSIRHAQVYINIDATYVYLKRFKEAIQYSLKALEIAENENHNFGIAISNVNLGGNYLALENLTSAKKHLDIGYAICKENKFDSLYVNAIMKLSDYCLKIEETAVALNYTNEGLEIAAKYGLDEHAIYLQNQLILIYEKMQDYKSALMASKKYNEIKVNSINSENMKIINSLQLEYSTEKKELELSELKIKQQELEIEKRDSELAALKSQMNPHFIFNALNSIQELYTIGDKKMANEQMANFASLTRKVLDVSGKQKIDLSDEIDILTKYLELEGIRFENEFSYQINLSENIDEDYIQLPPMLIQPYVENAIKHGLLHKKGAKQLNINFSLNENERILFCVVIDNGIGRNASAEINKNRSNSHVSFATSATQKRLDLINKDKANSVAVLFDDVIDEQQKIVGTKVIIQIPL